MKKDRVCRQTKRQFWSNQRAVSSSFSFLSFDLLEYVLSIKHQHFVVFYNRTQRLHIDRWIKKMMPIHWWTRLSTCPSKEWISKTTRKNNKPVPLFTWIISSVVIHRRYSPMVMSLQRSIAQIRRGNVMFVRRFVDRRMSKFHFQFFSVLFLSLRSATLIDIH